MKVNYDIDVSHGASRLRVADCKHPHDWVFECGELKMSCPKCGLKVTARAGDIRIYGPVAVARGGS